MRNDVVTRVERYSDAMTVRALPQARDEGHASGLDTSNGLEFVQDRIALFARVIGLISFTFLSVGAASALVLHFTLSSTRTAVANVVGVLILATVWALCRWRRWSLIALERLDAVALIGSCTAWAFFVEPPVSESIHEAVISVAVTLLARTIMVPSKASRTLRLTVLAALPLTTLMWSSIGSFGSTAAPSGPLVVTMTAAYQTLLLSALIWLATTTSRTLYDLRRRVREANELGQYALEEKLGAGGMGEVWRARHRLLVRSAAIKLIRPEFLALNHGDPTLVLRRFEREALATAALRSPHTVHSTTSAKRTTARCST